jgi:response regulator RpfG family c-di-GMP phosphodiesterase
MLSTWDISALLIQDLPDVEPDELTFLTTVRMIYPNLISLVLTEQYNERMSEELINRVGVFRYIDKPISITELKSVVELALARHELYKQSPDLNLRRLERDIIKSEVLSPKEELIPSSNMISKVKSWFQQKQRN